MFDIIMQGLKNTGNEALANQINDVKKIRDFDWTTHRYAAMGNDNGKWFTLILIRESLNADQVKEQHFSRKEHTCDVTAENYFNSMK